MSWNIPFVRNQNSKSEKAVRVTDSGRRGRHVVERIVAVCREFVTT